MRNWTAVLLTLWIAASCRQENTNQNTTTKNSYILSVPGPFISTNDYLYYHDLAVVNGRLYLLAEVPPSGAYTSSRAVLYMSDHGNATAQSDWHEVGSPMTGTSNGNPQGTIKMNFVTEDAGFLIGISVGQNIFSTINETMNGGWSWKPVIANVPGVIQGVNGYMDTTTNQLVITAYGGRVNTQSGAFLNANNPNSFQLPAVTLPVPSNGPILMSFDRNLGYLSVSMTGEMWARENFGFVQLFDVIPPIPVPSNSVRVPEDVLSVTYRFAPTSISASSAVPSLALGRYGLRRSSGYEQYPTDIVAPVIGALAAHSEAWIVDSDATIWYSSDQGKDWQPHFTAGYPRFFTDGKIKNTVFFVSRQEGMWILTAGTHLMLYNIR